MSKTLILSLSICLLSHSVSNAGYVLSFSPATNTIPVGGMFNVDIILTQTDNADLIAGGDIRLGADGVFDAGFNLDNSSTAVATGMFQNAGPDGFANSSAVPSTSAQLNVTSSTSTAVFGSNTNPSSLILGQYKYTGQSVGTATITFSDASMFDDWVFGNDAGGSDATVLAGSGSLAITVVPEPSPFLLFGVLATAFAGWRRFRSDTYRPALSAA